MDVKAVSVIFVAADMSLCLQNMACMPFPVAWLIHRDPRCCAALLRDHHDLPKINVKQHAHQLEETGIRRNMRISWIYGFWRCLEQENSLRILS